MTHIVTISGFTEDYRRTSGTERLFREVIRPWDEMPGVRVYDLRPWDADVVGLAEWIKRESEPEPARPEVIIVAYSWGAGFAVPKLARECLRRGIRVKAMLLCDPVFRPLWLPTWFPFQLLCLRSLIPTSARIRIPDGVESVGIVRQLQTRPGGHAVKFVDSLDSRFIGSPTRLRFHRVLDADHTDIDGDPQWHSLVYKTLNDLLEPHNNPVTTA